MAFLIISSILLAFACPSSKKLFSDFNPFMVSTVFCLSSAVLFSPLCKWGRFSKLDFLWLILIGVVQFGLMYSCFQAALFFLQGHEVALLLISTPIYVAVIDSSFSKNWTAGNFCAIVFLATINLLIIEIPKNFCFQWQGVVLVQLCNMFFALGQVLVKKFFESHQRLSVKHCAAVLYLGGAAVCLPLAMFSLNKLDCAALTLRSIFFMASYGVVCCGLCHLLWNMGVVKVSAKILAVMNNLQIPLAVIISCLVFGERIRLHQFLGSLIILCLMFLPIFLEKKHSLNKN